MEVPGRAVNRCRFEILTGVNNEIERFTAALPVRYFCWPG